MKKNKMMRTASGLLVATLLTTGVISGTFAKYTTEDSANDTARVAKWGVNLAVSGSLYGKNYSAKGENENGNTAVVNAKGATVASKDESKLVAPGTKSSDDGGLHIFLTGTPEVSTKISATIKEQNIYLGAGNYGVMVKVDGITEENFEEGKYYVKSEKNYTAANNYAKDLYKLEDTIKVDTAYYPVKYSGAGVTGTTGEDSLKLIALKYVDALKKDGNSTINPTNENGYTIYTIDDNNAKDYDPNQNLATVEALKNTLNAQISWEWAYHTDDDTDKKDTILGNLIAKYSDNPATWDVVKESNGIYETINVDENGLAKVASSDDPIASLKTGFDITITATQVD